MTRSRTLPPLYQDSAESGRLILRDGSTATVAIAETRDKEGLKGFFQRLSPESRYSRFFSPAEPEDRLLTTLCSPSPASQLSLIVTRTVDGEKRIIAVGSYIATDSHTAEVAVAVDDAFHGKGIGTILLERLALIATRHGFVQFWATTHTFNRPMIEIFRHSGFQVKETLQEGCIQFDFPVIPTKQSVDRSEMLDRIFTTASMLPFFRPRSVAVIGASRDPSNLGNRILRSLISSGFHGPVYPVNPTAAVVGSIHAYPSVKDIPEPVDLAVVVVPRNKVLDVVDDCAARGVRAILAITAGFAEVDAEGRDLQNKLVEKVRGYGMRLVGPNCMGIINTDPEILLNASFSPVFPPAGRVAMLTQSGALGLAILSFARQRQLGFSTFVSAGNKADVSGNDLLQYWEGDVGTDVILLYLESFGNPRRFARLARRVSRSKPIIAVKSGRTLAGKRAAGSHTAAMAASDVAVDALFRQTGVIRAETLEEMFDLAAALESQPLPAGRRVGIVTNAGGPGILCADMCEAHHLTVPELSPKLRAQLSSFLPATASVANPVDMIASASPEQYLKTIQALLASDEIDALIVIHIPIVTASLEPALAGMRKGIELGRKKKSGRKPVFFNLMSEDNINASVVLSNGERIPTYGFPETPASVLGKVVSFAEWKKRPLGSIVDFRDIHPESAREVCKEVISKRGPGWLSAEETRSVLTSMSLPLPAGGIGRSAEEAAEIAASIGFPVAVKLTSSTIVHKTELGGVLLNLDSKEAVTKAFGEIRHHLQRIKREKEMEGVLVQPMMSGGVEVMIGVTQDSLFGPLIAFGLGGIHVEILGDVCFRVLPLTDQDARDMVREIKGFRLLEGYRGHPSADVAAIENVLLRIARLVEEVPEIHEIDLNPIFSFAPGHGCCIVDARIKVGDSS